MQITKCYVQNFGKLQDYTLTFNCNFNTILEQNGWGKSTLATFVKAILFGLSSTTKRDLDDNERQKYLTWGRETFGGYVEFVLNNHPYRLERKFGSKQNQDSATLYDLNTNKTCTTYSPNIMEEYFGINSETFERSTYIAQGHITTEINDGIRAKLGNLLQNEQQNNFNAAIDKITDLRKQKQLYRGKGGEIDDIRQKIDATNLKLAHAQEQKAQLDILQTKSTQELQTIAQKQKELSDIEKQLSQIDKQHAQNIELERYDELQQKLTKLKGEYQDIVKFFNNQTPTPQMLDQVQNDINKYNTQQIELANTTSTKNDELNALQKFFARGVPTHQKLDEMFKNEQRLRNLETNPFVVQTIDRNNNASLHNYTPLYCLFSLIAIMVGVLCIGVFSKMLIGIIFAGLGGLGVITSLIVFFVQKNKHHNIQLKQTLDEQKHSNKTQKQHEQINQEIQVLRNCLQEFVAQYLTPTSSIINDLNTIKFNLTKYEYLQNIEQTKKEKTNTLNSDLVQTKSNLDRFFAVYYNDFSQNYQTMLNGMHLALNNYSRLSDEIKNTTLALNEYIKKTGIDPNKKVTPTELQKSAILNEQKRNLQNVLNELAHAHGQTTASIQTLTSKVENIDIYQNELEQYKDQEKDITHEIKVLDNIKKYLERANDNLNSKYISPMTERFVHYAGLISSTPLNIALDSDMNVSVEMNGAKRDKKYLSLGYRDILNLCMRFALIDAIFTGEQPPIILDDPFVNLDEQNTKNALDLLKQIAKDKQIIYLSCHPSRTNK